MGRTHSKPNSQAQTVGRVTRDTLKIHRLLHKPFDENPCFRPFFTETGAFHAGFRYYSKRRKTRREETEASYGAIDNFGCMQGGSQSGHKRFRRRTRPIAGATPYRGVPEIPPTPPLMAVPRILRRAAVAQRLSISLRTVDKLPIKKIKLPGRIRAAGFLESDVNDLLKQ